MILEGGYFFQLKSCWRKRKVCLLAAASAGLAQELFFKSCLRFKLKVTLEKCTPGQKVVNLEDLEGRTA